MAGGKRPPPFANAVDNLGSKTPAISSCSLAREANLVLRAREHRFNRSSTISSSVALAPVEKTGPDFHRLAAPTCSGLVLLQGPCLLPGGDCNKGSGGPQGIAPDG